MVLVQIVNGHSKGTILFIFFKKSCFAFEFSYTKQEFSFLSVGASNYFTV